MKSKKPVSVKLARQIKELHAQLAREFKCDFSYSIACNGKLAAASNLKDGHIFPVARGVTLNEGQKLYVIPCEDGFSCLGFEVCQRRAFALADELGIARPAGELGSLELYNGYEKAISAARERNARTGWRSASELTPQLAGLEGKNVEVIDCYSETRRFRVGKSTGFIPCHLEIEGNENGGGAVSGAPFKSIKIIS